MMKQFCKRSQWKRWVSAVLIVVMTVLNPMTSMADGGIGGFWGKSTAGGRTRDDDGIKFTGKLGTGSDADREEQGEGLPDRDPPDKEPPDKNVASDSDGDKEEGFPQNLATMSNARGALHQVRFYAKLNGKWSLLNEQYVGDGENADAPEEVPELIGYTFHKWDKDYLCITSSRDIYASYYWGTLQTHAVDFMDTDGRLLQNREYVIHGASAYPPREPVLEGHTFIKWDKPHFEITEDTQIKAVFKEGVFKTYSVYFKKYIKNQGYRRFTYERVKEGEAATLPDEIPLMEGRSFHKWDVDYLRITSDREISPSYYNGLHETHAVDFMDSDGKLLQNRVYVIHGASAYPPREPVLEGHTFIKWDKPHFEITEDTQIKAVFEEGVFKTYSVYFKKYIKNQGYRWFTYERVKEGEAATLPDEIPELEGRSFHKWGVDYLHITSDREISPSFHNALYETHAVDFLDSDGKPLQNREYLIHGAYIYLPKDPVLEGHTFIKWDNFYFTVTKDTQIKAVFEEGIFKTYPVYFKRYFNNLGWRNFTYERVREGGTATAPDLIPERDGYTFIGWNKDWLHINKELEIYPNYIEGDYTTHKISYFGLKSGKKGNSLLKQEWVLDGANSVPPVPDLVKGYTFAGWEKSNLYTNINSSRSINAMYYNGAVRTHIVEFADYDGRPLYNPQYIPYGGTPAVPEAPKRAGYTFTGWDKGFEKIMSSIKVQAVYQPGNLTTYTVTFYGKTTGSDTWQQLKQELVPAGRSATPPEVPTNGGYLFRAWDKDYSNIQSNQAVYATYDPNPEKAKTYIVEFWSGGKKPDKRETVVEGGDATPPKDPLKPGFRFQMWSGGYKSVTGDQEIIQVVAIFTEELNDFEFQRFKGAIEAIGLSQNLEESLIELGWRLKALEEQRKETRIAGAGVALLIPGVREIMIVAGVSYILTVKYLEIIKALAEIMAAFKMYIHDVDIIEALGIVFGEDLEAAEDAAAEGDGETDITEFRLPSWNKVTVDIDHIISGHTTGGGRGDDNKDKWPEGMTEAAIIKAIEEAYKNAEKAGTIQYSWQNGVEHARQFFEGVWNSRTVQFWFDYTTNQIDSAWPK